MSDNITLEFIGERLEHIQAEQTAMRAELREIKEISIDAFEHSHRLERRLNELTADVGVTVRLEVSKAMMRLEDKLDRIIDDHERRLSKLETAP
jgi:septation ring formation regulator EzrA